MVRVKTITIEQLRGILSDLPDNPRIVASGNFAMPKTVLGIIDEVVPEYRLNMLNAQPGVPEREGVVQIGRAHV